MKVRLLTGIAGDRFSHEAGEVVEFAADDAARLIESGAAVPEAVEPESPESKSGTDWKEKRSKRK